jgi:N-acetylmuramoyl-L-alanine amidase
MDYEIDHRIATVLRAFDLDDSSGCFARLYLLEAKRPEAAASAPASPPKAATPARRPPTTRALSDISIETVDASGKPIADIRCLVLPPDGLERTVVTDQDGFAMVDRLPPGNCKIRLPDVDGPSWQASGGQSGTRVEEAPSTVHRVQQGECLVKIANRYGIRDWKRVWQHAQNEALRKKRKNPNVLLPGDPLFVPGVRIHEIQRSTGTTQRIVLTGDSEIELDLVLEGGPGQPLAGQPYVARYFDGGKDVVIEGRVLSNQGRLQLKVPVTVETLEITLSELAETVVLTLAGLDPTLDDSTRTAEITGVQQRLHALGYHCAVSGELDEATRACLARFQRAELARKEPAGELDPETRFKLEEIYGV